MKTAILAVLLLLAVASMVSGDTTERGNTTQKFKSRYGDETYFPVNLRTLQLYKFVSLLNYDLRHDVWRNAGKTPSVLVLHYRQNAGSLVV
jgi:hypothetical protein